MRVNLTLTVDAELKEKAMAILRIKDIPMSRLVDDLFLKIIKQHSKEISN